MMLCVFTAAMQTTLSQFYDLERLRHVYERTRGAIADRALKELVGDE